MKTYSKLDINSFLTSLMDGWNEEFATIVVNEFHNLSLGSASTTIHTEHRNDLPVTGYTDEAGNISISNEIKKTVIIGESQEQFARVGQFKIKRVQVTNEFSVIKWWHFWESNITTMNLDKGPNSTFGVVYLNGELKPVALMRWDYVIRTGLYHFGWRDWIDYLKFFVQCLFTSRGNTRVSVRSFVSIPTVIFCVSDYDSVIKMRDGG